MDFLNTDSIEHYLYETWKETKPLAKLFRSASSGYLYDTGTNKILACRDEVYDLLRLLFERDVDEAIIEFTCKYSEKELLKSFKEIVSAMDEENVLMTKKASTFNLSSHYKDIVEILNTQVQSVNLEITQECNLRCLYCIYNDHHEYKRGHSNRRMSMETAKKAIEFTRNHSSQSEFVSIGFYGGEPLERFSFISNCVKYAKDIFDTPKLRFNITTNGTLLNEKIGKYLMQEGFTVMVSIDGPQEIHDRYRKDEAGNGSFKKTMKGLKILARYCNELKNGAISLNVVYAPPFSSRKLDEIRDYFGGIEWLPQNTNITTYYPTERTVPAHLVSEADLNEDKDVTLWAFEKYKEASEKAGTMIKSLLELRFAKLIQRPVFRKPLDAYYLNGCCEPGQRKSYIAADGKIHVCEKISSFAPTVGDVETGFDLETIQKFYIDEYGKKSMVNCANCWALRLCDVCYISAIDSHGHFDMEKKSQYCRMKCISYESTLGHLLTLMEEKPANLEYLKHFEMI